MTFIRHLTVGLSILATSALAAAPLPYGPDTCKTGFVFREAYPNDRVCVDPGIRRQVRADNAMASGTIQPGGGASGPDTCKNGLVWREARPQDHVCVSPEQREQAKNDNYYAQSRKLANASPLPKPPKRDPLVELGPDGKPLPGGGSAALCKLGGVKCPPFFIAAFDDNVGCVCRKQR
jgi:hypothetical protein